MSTLVAQYPTVGDLKKLTKDDPEKHHTIPFAQVSVIKGEVIQIGDHKFPLDEQVLGHVGHLLDIPTAYLERCPGSLRKTNIDSWLGQYSEADALLITGGGNGDTEMRGLFDASDSRIIPTNRVLSLLSSILPATAQVRELTYGEGELQVSISNPALKYEPKGRVGDITEGGLRLYSHIAPSSAPNRNPWMSEYAIRLECTNGMTRRIDGDLIKLRGRTVEEVFEEMETLAQVILGDGKEPGRVGQTLEQFVSLAHVGVDEPDQFVAREADRYSLTDGTFRRIVDRIPELDADHRTQYDVLNLITAAQHDGKASRAERARLQELGGHEAARLGSLHLCSACQQPVDD